MIREGELGEYTIRVDNIQGGIKGVKHNAKTGINNRNHTCLYYIGAMTRILLGNESLLLFN